MNTDYSTELINQQILAGRAAILAKELSPEVPDDSITVLHFQLAYEQYAVETRFLREALFIKEIAVLPLTPKFVVGVVNVHGEIVSALDIRKFFNLPGEPINDLNRLLVLNDKDMTFGILVDRIRGIRTFSRAEIRKVNVTVTGIKNEYVLGVTSENIVILNGDVLLNDPAIIVRQI